MVKPSVFTLLTTAVFAVDVPLTTFDGSKETTQTWNAMNDPVMGGKSKATFTIDGDTAVFDGAVAIVPSLKAPGFCNMQSKRQTFPDISGADALELVARQTSDYKGWRFTISDGPRNPDSGAPFFVRGSYKANVEIPASDEFQTVTIPFNAFTYKWSDTTGEPTVKCVDDASVCPVEKYLKSPKQLAIIAEGIEGSFHLEVKSIKAVNTATWKAESEIKLATFDGTKESTLSWRKTLDPVMGGASTGDFEITDAGTGKFSGRCNIVKSLAAPGFCKIEGTGRTLADITGADSLLLKVKSSTPDYQGFKIAFGAPGIPSDSIFERSGAYKTEFYLSNTEDWQVVQVPLGNFSRDTSGYTGRCDTKDPRTGGKQHYCCSSSPLTPSKDDVCVESKFLSKINDLQIWAEGVEGDYDLEIEWIGANPSTVVV